MLQGLKPTDIRKCKQVWKCEKINLS